MAQEELWTGFSGKGLYAKLAEHARKDSDGNPIVDTYARKDELPGSFIVSASVSGRTLTLTPDTGNPIEFSDTGDVNTIESISIDDTSISPSSNKDVAIPLGTTLAYGVIKLTDDPDSQAEHTAVTPAALQAAIADFGGFEEVGLTGQGEPDVATPSTKVIYLTKDGNAPYVMWIYKEPSGGNPYWQVIAGDGVQSVKVNGTELTKDAAGAVNVPLASATESGGVTTYVAGAMSGEDKGKLDSARSFSRVKVVESESPAVSVNLDATVLNDTLELVAGDNVSLEAGLVIGGRQYKTVKIGNQVWMAENLDFLPDGISLHDEFDLTQEQTDFYEPVAWYYNNDQETAKSRNYGLLYNSEAVDYLEANKSTLFPGWHVPTQADMETLVNTAPRDTVRASVPWAGGDWHNEWCTNTTGFTAIPNGNVERQWRSTLPRFYREGTGTYLWTCTGVPNGSGTEACKYCAILTGYTYFNVGGYGYIVGSANAIRLVKDDSTLPNRVRISSDAALEKSVYGTYVADEQGHAVTDEQGNLIYSENAVELYDTFKGTKFGAARAVADRLGNEIDETYATKDAATASSAGLMSAVDKAKLDGITDYVVSASVSGGTLTLTPKNGEAVTFTGDTNVIEGVKVGNDTLVPDVNKVVTVPLFDETHNGAVTAPTSTNRNAASFLNGMGDWSMLEEVTDADIDDIFVDKPVIAGRKYKVVQIGDQLWTAENLDYQIPDVAFNPTSDTGEGAMQMYYAVSSDYSLDGTYKLGMMYNGGAVNSYLIPSIPTLAPGWHVATKADWDTLVTYIGGSGNVSKLKALDGSITQGFPSGWNGTADYGFNLLPGGEGGRKRDSNPNYGGIGTLVRFRLGSGSGYNTDAIYIDQSSYSASTNLSYAYCGYVRLVKDAN